MTYMLDRFHQYSCFRLHWHCHGIGLEGVAEDGRAVREFCLLLRQDLLLRNAGNSAHLIHVRVCCISRPVVAELQCCEVVMSDDSD